jgi:hypothetical protein
MSTDGIGTKKKPAVSSRLFIIFGAKGKNRIADTGIFRPIFFKIQKYRYFKQLILFHFFSQPLVSFGTIWKYLTLPGTIWAQSKKYISN